MMESTCKTEWTRELQGYLAETIDSLVSATREKKLYISIHTGRRVDIIPQTQAMFNKSIFQFPYMFDSMSNNSS